MARGRVEDSKMWRVVEGDEIKEQSCVCMRE